MKFFNTKNSYFINLSNKLFKNNNLFNISLDKKTKNLEINIPSNITLDKPIYLNNNKNLNINIIINNNSKIDIIDHKSNSNLNSKTNILCKDNTAIDYYLIQEHNTATVNIDQNTSSHVVINLLSSNLNNNKLQLNINLLNKLAKIYVNALQNTQQNAINQINLLINHLSPDCSSYTVTRSIAADKSTANITGKILVNKNANNTYADLQNKSLLLSKYATINSCPELDIYNQDIACSHGSSIGHLEQDALFYMQARGINIDLAKTLLLQAFIEPIIKNIKYQQIIKYLQIY